MLGFVGFLDQVKIYNLIRWNSFSQKIFRDSYLLVYILPCVRAQPSNASRFSDRLYTIMKRCVVLLVVSAVEGIFPVTQGLEYDVLDELMHQLESIEGMDYPPGDAEDHLVSPSSSTDSGSPIPQPAQISEESKSLIIVGLMEQLTEYLPPRKLKYARQWKMLSLYQAVRAVESMDYPMFESYAQSLLGATVVPAWFHQILVSNSANSLSPEAIRSIATLSGSMDHYFKSEAHVARVAQVWLKYCVFSLSTYIGEPPCLLKTLTRPNGTSISMWTLSLPSVRFYLSNELSAIRSNIS